MPSIILSGYTKRKKTSNHLIFKSILNIIKLEHFSRGFLLEQDTFISTTNIDIYKLWKDILEEITKDESISALSFDIWFKTLEIEDIKSNTLVISTPTVSNKSMLLKKYKDRIINAANNVYGAITNVEIIVKDSTEDYEQSSESSGKFEEKLTSLNKSQNSLASKKSQFKFDPKYTFDNFVIGGSNQFACAAAKAVAEEPGSKMNPLFIYGGSGLGKTHLLFAIGNYVTEHHPKLNVIYVTTYQFVNDYTNALQNNKANEFKEVYSKADILIIDDIQGIINKTATQEQFFNLFNELYQNGKQIIITSDKQPKELNPLEERLRSRFEWGMLADIGVPDIETRIAILNKKAQIERYKISREVIEYIAEISPTNVRTMEGNLSKAVFYSNLLKEDIVTLSSAREALKDVAREDSETIDATKIIDIVCKFYNIKKEDVLARKRTKNIAETRQIAMYLITEYINMPLESVGNIFGKDHATVIYAKNKIADDIKKSKKLEIQINDMKQMIEGK